MKKEFLHYADSSWDSEYGPSYIPYCIQGASDEHASYFYSDVTCPKCLEKLGGKKRVKKLGKREDKETKKANERNQKRYAKRDKRLAEERKRDKKDAKKKKK
jgi:hypothetical protein